MRDLETIDRELRNLASVRQIFSDVGISASKKAEIAGQVDDLLDERNRLSDQA
jgi:hypothetical protein